MKYIFLNLKRFDVPAEYGGVNRLAPISSWGAYIMEQTQDSLRKFDSPQHEFVHFFPEVHLLGALGARSEGSPVQVGCQGVYRLNTSKNGNFGAFTTNRPANSMKAMNCMYTLIGHCEERNDKNGILAEAGVQDRQAVNRLLNQEVVQAVNAGMKVLYCVGETEEELETWQDVLREQVGIGLKNVDQSKVVIAYEPIWSIGPGKQPADKEHITKIACFLKELTGGIDVVYGGGLKLENASMLASIDEIDGGLIALTRFQGEIGFYPDEYIEIVRKYLASLKTT